MPQKAAQPRGFASNATATTTTAPAGTVIASTANTLARLDATPPRKSAVP